VYLMSALAAIAYAFAPRPAPPDPSAQIPK
jgi:hypothetical protein